MRRLLLVSLLVLLLVSAGCLIGTQDPTPTPTVDETPTPTVSGTSTASPVPSPTTTPSPSPTATPTSTPPSASDASLVVHYLDVGQADATVVEFPNGETMLIDSGDWPQEGSEVISYLDDLGVDRLDHLVATHPHADHIGGHAEIIAHFEEHRDGVGAVYDSGVSHTSQTYEDYIDALETHEPDVFEVRAGDSLDVGGAAVTFVNPQPSTHAEELHPNSVGLVIEWGTTSFLFTGDAEHDAEADMVAEWADSIDVDVYHAGHHGSTTSSSESFLSAVEPTTAIISSARDSQYGHPHDETLDSFATHNIETYWTGVHDTVRVIADGSGYDVEPSTDATTDPSELQGMKPGDATDITRPLTATSEASRRAAG